MTRVLLHAGQLLQPVPGGIGRYVRALAQGLPASGIEVVPFAAGSLGGAFDGQSPTVDLGFPSGRLRYELWHRFRRPTLRINADIVHAPSLAIPPAGKHPLIVTIHDVAFLRYPEHFTRHGRSFHQRGLDIARREAEVIVAPSNFSADEIKTAGFEDDRVRVIPHGIDLPGPGNDEEVGKVLRALRLPERYVLFVGTLEPRKGLPLLLDAFASLRTRRTDVSLVVVGPSGWGDEPDLKQPGVHALGAINDQELDAVYRGASLLAYLSSYEGFGLPPVEAMSRGCPVVTSNAGSLPEVVGDAAMLTPNGDLDALVSSIGTVLDDDQLRAELIDKGHERAQQLTWERTVAAHADLYRELSP